MGIGVILGIIVRRGDGETIGATEGDADGDAEGDGDGVGEGGV